MQSLIEISQACTLSSVLYSIHSACDIFYEGTEIHMINGEQECVICDNGLTKENLPKKIYIPSSLTFVAH